MNSPPTTPDGIEPLMTYKAAGRILGLTERSVYAMVQRGDLPAVRIGRNVRIDPADLRAFIERLKTCD